MSLPDFTSPEYTDYGAAAQIPDFAAPEYTDYGPPAPPQPSLWEDAKGVAGSMTRGAYKGTLSLPALITDPLVRGINSLFGTNFVEMGEGVDAMGDSFGVPRMDEGRPRELVEGLSGAAAGGVTGAGVLYQASRIPANAKGIPAQVLRTLGERPVSQGIAAGTGAFGAHVAREQGLGETGQTLAGMAAATVAPGAGTAGSMGRAMATKGGRRDTAAQALRALTHDPDSAIANIDDTLAAGSPLRAPKTDASVPRYRQPTAVAAADAGLASVHNTVASMAGYQPRFITQEVQNNAALLDYLGRKFGPERAQIIATRDAEIAGRIKKLARESRPTNPTPFMARLDALEMVPRGQDAEARAVVTAVRKEFDSLFERGGYEWITNPMYLYQGPRKTIGAMIEKKMAGDTPLTSNSLTLLRKLRSSLDDVIDEGMPGFKDYWMRPFAKLSAAADRREIFDDILERSSATAQSAVSKDAPHFVQASRFESAMRRADKSKGQQRSPLQTLTTPQQEALANVRAELRKGAMLGAARTKGSDTFKNLTMGALVGRLVMGGGLGDDAPRWVRSIAERIPVRFTGGADEEVMDILADALLDPAMAKHLLVRANQMSAESFANALARRTSAAAAGSTAVE